jgi:NAD/NADP transhydrogenase beta subunit
MGGSSHVDEPTAVFMVVGNVVTTVSFCGFITLWVWMDHRNKQRLRTIEQEGRLRILESGVPVDEPALARAKSDGERSRAIGAIGVATAISLSIGLVVVSLMGMAREPIVPAMLIVAWAVGAPAILGAVAICVANLKPPKSASNIPPEIPRIASTGFTAARPGEGVSPHA